MKKFLLFLVVPLLTFGLFGCDDEDDVTPMDLQLLDGVWEVVDGGNQNVFVRDSYFVMTTHPHGNYGGPKGDITTFFLKANGTPFYEKRFSWSIDYMENHLPLLDLVLEEELDREKQPEGDYHYKITRLTDSHMWWQVNTDSDNSVIKFKRRPDIQVE